MYSQYRQCIKVLNLSNIDIIASVKIDDKIKRYGKDLVKNMLHILSYSNNF